MPKKSSAGLLLFRRRASVEVLLVHPGGPFWTKKDAGAWSVPKGEFNQDEEEGLAAAKREFTEETGFTADGTFVALSPVKQSSGKVIHVWAVEGDCNPAQVKSNTFSMEWPPQSGQSQEFPEVDRAAWYSVSEARDKLTSGQVPILEEFASLLGIPQRDSAKSPNAKDPQGSLF